MQEPQTKKYFFIAMLLAATVLVAVILWPFVTVIALSAALSVVFYPIYRWINKKIAFNISWIASLITVLLFLIILCTPIFFIGVQVLHQSQDIYAWIVKNGDVSKLIGKLNRYLGNIVPAGQLNLEDHAAAVVSQLTTAIGNMFTATISTLWSLLLVVLSMFYFLKDGRNWKKTLIRFSPLSDDSDQQILSKLKLAVNGILRGYLLVAIVQGVLMGVGLWIFGIPNPALWGVLTGIASLIPTIGTALVSIPAVMFLFVAGNTGQAIGLAVWSAVAVGAIDNLLGPYLMGQHVDIHPLLVLFAVLGGIVLLGPVGILIGPLAISFMYALMSVYKTELRSN